MRESALSISESKIMITEAAVEDYDIVVLVDDSQILTTPEECVKNTLARELMQKGFSRESVARILHLPEN